MGFFSRLAGLFSRGAHEDGQLLQGMHYAKTKQPEKAIQIYDSLLTTSSLTPTVRARTLFNRALAYSSMSDDERALADLQKALALPGLPENVQSAARAQVARIKKRAP